MPLLAIIPPEAFRFRAVCAS